MAFRMRCASAPGWKMRHGLASKNTGGQTDVPRMTRARKKDENTLCSGDPDMNVNMFMGVWKTDGMVPRGKGQEPRGWKQGSSGLFTLIYMLRGACICVLFV